MLRWMGVSATTPAMSRHVETLWPDLKDLFATGEDVSRLLDHPGWKAIQRVIEAEKNTLDRSLDSPHRALDQADYALKHGRRGALTAAADAAAAIIGRAQVRHTEQARKHEDGAESPSER